MKPKMGSQYSFRAPPREFDAFDGVLPIDKPAGPTSHDIVDAIRGQFQIKKVGHGGTLDPAATGLLVMLLGKATKLSNRFIGSDKSYTGVMHLGAATNSYDADGEITAQGDYSAVTREILEAEMRKRVGDQMQKPPMVSAVKVGGVPLYKSARKGKEVERDARLIHVYEFRLDTFEPPEASFLLRCTKGTYVRSLCHEIGEDLGCHAHLSALRRTQSGDITLEGVPQLEEVLTMTKDELTKHIIPMLKFSAYL